MGERGSLLESLYETKEAGGYGGRVVHRVFASTMFVGICLVWVYRAINIPRGVEIKEGTSLRYWAWIAMFIAELSLGIYWTCTQALRWRVVHQFPFKQRLSQRLQDKSPAVDIFICTADPILEPPILVINTVLSTMSFNYPTHKLSVYLSDDGGSEITFYALLEAYEFSKHWIPFCKRFKVEPMSPEAYFGQHYHGNIKGATQEWSSIKKLYHEMKNRIEYATHTGKVPENIRNKHKGFLEWNSNITKKDHQSIVQIIIDGKDTEARDDSGCQLPTLVYMSREKRPHFPHHFKAGAMNALIRVSAEISNAPFILNLDCDMYANKADTIEEALCFFMDEEKGHEIAYVQFPQNYENLTKNDLYSNDCCVINQIELAGLGGYEAALYCGTGCFHRRESLCGKHFKDFRRSEKIEDDKETNKTVSELEEASKVVASCSYEDDTKWGKEKGLVYGFPVEDIVTGLTILCRGWKSVYYNPVRKAFVGVCPTTLEVALVQHMRWSEGMFQIFFSKYCPFIYSYRKISLGAQMGYCSYLLWAPISFPILCYVILPPICLIHGVSLFPELQSPWFLPFAYVFVAKYSYNLYEALVCGHTLKGWWNEQRIWVIRRATSHMFGFLNVIRRKLGLSETTFAVTAKVVTEDASKRYEQEVMEFGSSSIMFTIIATLAMLNLFGLVWGIKRIVLDLNYLEVSSQLGLLIISALLVALNLPVFGALFIRNDRGSLPSSVMFGSVVLACFIAMSCSYISSSLDS